MKKAMLKTILFALPKVLRHTGARHEDVMEHMRARDCTIQIRLKDRSIGRSYTFKAGHITSKAGIHSDPDMEMIFKSVSVALKVLKPPPDRATVVHAMKNFKVEVSGDDELTVWFMQLINLMDSTGWEHGTPMPDGTVRYTTNTNGGPMFVFVKDGRIVRTCPIDLDETDPDSWSIEARGQQFTPLRKATVNVFAMTLKSLVYSDKRLLYPMKRVDFDPNGERNTSMRGRSGYERISWDEALDIVCGEIKRQKVEHGPGAIMSYFCGHQQWGNVGYYLSSLMRFGNILGVTQMALSPVSWEGWYWGAQHHFGNSMRLGNPSVYGTLEDCLKECEMIVFWSSDPETTCGVYAGFEGTQRRLWAKQLGIEFVHIDPHCNSTAQLLGGKWIPIKPTTDSAMAQAIMYVWIKEGLYDEEYVRDRTTGFEQWRAYLLGETDGVAKTPGWQEGETGIPAKDVVSLARAWGNRKTYLSAGGMGGGFGGACRASSGQQWARNMVLMMAMQGWGKPGINFGNLQVGAPLDMSVYFPGYAEGGLSGDFTRTAAGVNNYVRMPHVLSMNPVKQTMPRERFMEGITEGHCEGYPWDGSSLEAQFTPITYPHPGYSQVHMLYRFGGSSFGTTMHSARLVKMYRDPSMEFVVNQSVWDEGEAQFADIILPACSQLERYDIGEWANCAGYIHHNQNQLNHRIVTMQHKCIEPLGESKSDYQIFLDILTRLDFGAMYSEGCSELDWCKRVFDSSDIAESISWKAFLKRGYYVIPPESEETRDPVDMRWYAEGRKKDIPEPHPLPADYSGEFRSGLQTQSGKIEFVPQSIERGDPDNPERPALNKYTPSWEGPQTQALIERFPLQLVSTHPRYSFHTHADAKDSATNDIKDHRMLVDGYYYWILRVSTQDAEARGLVHRDLVKMFNERGAVICAIDVSPLMCTGVLKSWESCADIDLIEDGEGTLVDRAGCVNILTPSRTQARGTDAIAPNSCLVEIEKWSFAEVKVS